MRADRSSLPPLGPEPPFTFPVMRRSRLANGLDVRTIEHHSVPVITAMLLLPVGAALDPTDRPGLAALTGDLLDEGAGELTGLDVHEALGRIGAQIETEVGADATLITLATLARFAERGLALLADMAVRPRFEQRDFDRVRDLRINRLIQLRNVPSALAERAFARAVYGAHPYGHAAIGAEDALAAVTRDEVVSFHAAQYRPGRATIILVGDATHERLRQLAETAFGEWNGAREVQPGALGPPTGGTERLLLIDRPGSPQSELRLGHVGVPRNTPDYYALMALNMVLGGQFVSRLNMKLREEKGYTYGVRTAFEFRVGAGPFVAHTSVQSEATADAIRDVLGELEAIRGARPVTRDELELGRAALTRGYPRNFETAEQLGRSVAQLALYELPDDYFSTFVRRALAVDEAAVTRAAATHIDPSRCTVVVVGDAGRIGPSLAALGIGDVSEVAAAAV
jgi:zinc protease